MNEWVWVWVWVVDKGRESIHACALIPMSVEASFRQGVLYFGLVRVWYYLGEHGSREFNLDILE